MTPLGTALVTGGGTGIGRAIAQELAMRGHHVIVTGRRRGPLEEAVASITASGGTAEAARLDVTEEDSTDALVARVGSDRLDVVVANAGVFVKGNVAELALTDWRQQMDVNLTGVFLTLRTAVRIMRDQDEIGGSRGHLFAINSGAGVAGFPTGAAYAAAKHGVRGLTASLRAETALLGIRMTDVVVAATVDSEMSARRDVSKIPALSVGHAVVSCLSLPVGTTWDRIDIGQMHS